MRERVLVEDGEIAHDIAASAMTGQYQRGERIIFGEVQLVPTKDDTPIYYVGDRRSEETVDVLNCRAISTATELVAALNRICENLEANR